MRTSWAKWREANLKENGSLHLSAVWALEDVVVFLADSASRGNDRNGNLELASCVQALFHGRSKVSEIVARRNLDVFFFV